MDTNEWIVCFVITADWSYLTVCKPAFIHYAENAIDCVFTIDELHLRNAMLTNNHGLLVVLWRGLEGFWINTFINKEFSKCIPLLYILQIHVNRTIA